MVLIATGDGVFAETIARTLDQWGVRHLRFGEERELELGRGEADVALQDIRGLADETQGRVRAIRQRYPEVEVILLNKPGNVAASIAGMKAGAADELIVPFETDALQTSVSEAWQRVRAVRKQMKKKTLLTRFSEAMMAATFAQAGDFDGALDLLDSSGSRPSGKAAAKKKDDGSQPAS